MVRFGGVGTICFINVNNVNVDTVTHCFLRGNVYIKNCSGAPSRLAHGLRRRKTRIRCRRGISLVPRIYGRPRSYLIICAPTIPTRRGRLACFQRGNFRVRGHTRILNALAHSRGNLYITKARKGAAASSVATRVLRRDAISYGTFLNKVAGGCKAGCVLSPGDSCIIVRTSRFSHSFR